MGERIGWLDNARAIGIVAVVAGHVTRDPAVWAALFHFHLPLFFMASGMVFTPRPWRETARRQAHALLVPYVAWLMIVAVSDLGIAAILGHRTYLPWDRPLAAIARLVLGGTYLVGPFGIFWFVTCLYLVQLVGGIVLRRGERVVWIAAFAALAIAHAMRHWPSPWGVIGVPLGLFFFLAGALYRRHRARLDGRATLLAIGAAGLVPVTAPLDIKIADFGTPLASSIAAIGLCHLIFVVARRVPAAPLASIGRASLVIMYSHLTIVYALRESVSDGAIAVLAVALPIGLWWLLRRSATPARLLLGVSRPKAAPTVA
jgi:fucose 4-O-acetylase-like acetyltransferase